MLELRQKRRMIAFRDAGGWRDRLRSSEYQVLLLSALYFAVLAPVAPGFASVENLGNVFSNLLPLLVVAVGQTCVLIAGGIDLTATSTIALASVTGAMVMSRDGGLAGGRGWAAVAGVGVMLVVGLLIGLLNGVSVTRFGMPAFIVTLTTMMFFSGLAIWLTKSKAISGLPPGFNAIGRESLLGVPYALLVAAAVAWALHLALSRSLAGRWLYAVGQNAQAARISGVPVERTVISAYVVSGLCAAVAAILYTGRMETGSPVMGQRILLDVIGAAVIGGTSLFGGKGKVICTAYGVLFITLIDNSLNLLGLSHFTIMMVKGGVILLAALLDAVRTKVGDRG